MPTPATGTDNLHGVAVYGHPVGVECKPCGHRGLVPAATIGAGKGNMRLLSTLRFVCANCGERQVSLTLFVTQDDVDAWMPVQPRDPLF